MLLVIFYIILVVIYTSGIALLILAVRRAFGYFNTRSVVYEVFFLSLLLVTLLYKLFNGMYAWLPGYL